MRRRSTRKREKVSAHLSSKCPSDHRRTNQKQQPASVNASSNYSNSSDLPPQNNNNTKTNGLPYNDDDDDDDESPSTSLSSSSPPPLLPLDGKARDKTPSASSTSTCSALSGTASQASGRESTSSLSSPPHHTNPPAPSMQIVGEPLRPQRPERDRQSADRHQRHGSASLARVRVGRSNEAAAIASQDVDLANLSEFQLSEEEEEEGEQANHVASARQSGRRRHRQINLPPPNSSFSSISRHQNHHSSTGPINLLHNHNNKPGSHSRYFAPGEEREHEGPLLVRAQAGCDSSTLLSGDTYANNNNNNNNKDPRLVGMDGGGHQLATNQQYHHYYAPALQDNQNIYLNSQATTTTTTCDEATSASNTDESARVSYQFGVGALGANNSNNINRMAVYQNSNQQISEQSPAGSSGDYHYYQVVVPENRHQIITSNHLEPKSYHHHHHHQPPAPPQTSSPCKSIQRIVSSLFTSHNHLNSNHQQQQQQLHQPDRSMPLPPIPTINQNLVSSEPLIRSSSWQNKTLIDLRLQQQQQPAQPAHYLESSLIQKTLPCNNTIAPFDGGGGGGGNISARYTQFPPNSTARPQAPAPIELSNIVQQPQHYVGPATEHLYCGLGTLRWHNQSGEMLLQQQQHQALYKSDGLNQSFHTLTDDNKNQNCFPYPHTSHPGPLPVTSMQINATSGRQPPSRGSGLASLGSSQSAGDSPMSSSMSPPKYKTKPATSHHHRRRPLFGWLDQSTKFFLVFLLMLASGFLLLAALLSPSSLPLPLTTTKTMATTTAPTGNTIPIGPMASDKALNEAIQQQSTYNEHKLTAGSQTERTNQQQPPISTNELPPSTQQDRANQMVATGSGNLFAGQFKNRTLPSGGAWPPSLVDLGDGGSLNSISSVREQAHHNTAATTIPSELPSLEVSHQRYWTHNNDADEEKVLSLNNYKACRGLGSGSECSSRGQCGDGDDDGTCFCYAGFSGPNCAIANCPNECSQNGKCKLRQNSSLNNLAAGNGVKAHLQSIGFQTTKPTRSRNSFCPKLSELEAGVHNHSQTAWAIRQQHNFQLPAPTSSSSLYDNRLEWRCVCDPGFMGPDCSQAREIHCDNKLDDDNDGLIDCEDDDCCSLPVCIDHHMCFKSPDPIRALEMWRPPNLNTDWDQHQHQHQQQSQPSKLSPLIPLNYSRSHRFYNQMRFMIGTQSYAKEWAFDKSRVAVVRGRVVKWRHPLSTKLLTGNGDVDGPLQNNELSEGIVSVRVDVVENAEAEFGFTLTREDGYFDMLVNGNEWITLLFNKNNYASIKRKVFVEANSIVLLEDNLEMWLTTLPGPTGGGGGSGGSGSGSGSSLNKPSDSMQNSDRSTPDTTFNLQPSVEIHRLVMALKRDDERKRNQLFDCLANGLHQSGQFRIPYEPLILEDPAPYMSESGVGQQQQQQLKTFILSSSGAFSGSLKTDSEAASNTVGDDDDNIRRQPKPKLVYNSAFFPPAASVVKPTVSIQLLGFPNSPFRQDHDGGGSDAEDSEGSMSTLKLKAVLVQLDIEGQSRRERLSPLPRLIYQFAWNRRNVYQQKVYGFGQLNLRIGYEFELIKPANGNEKNKPNLLAECLTIIDGPAHQIVHNSSTSTSASATAAATAFDKIKLVSSILSTATATTTTNSQANSKVVWFERKIYMEAHQLNQHSDLGKWTLDGTNRLDQDRQLIYFGSGWSLPYKLALPPTLSEPIQLLAPDQPNPNDPPPSAAAASNPEPTPPPVDQASRLMTRGPNSTMFILIHPKHAPLTSSQLVQLDSTGKRRLLEVPLSILANKLGLPMGDQFSNIYSAVPPPPSPPLSPQLGQASESEIDKQHDLIVNDIQILYNNYLSTLYLSSKLAGKMVQISYSSLLVLNRTLSSGAPTADADDSIDIEPLCGFGRQLLSSNSPSEAIRSTRLARLSAPHSMTLDEARQVLYFFDGPSSLMALDLVSHRVALLPVSGSVSGRKATTSHTGNEWPMPARLEPLKCPRQMLQMPLASYKPHRAHSLTWSRADSSLYFVDQNLVFGLRQDFGLELVASGLAPAKRTAAAAHLHSLAPACFGNSELGNIRGLVFDESNEDLLIVHQYQATTPTNSNDDRQQRKQNDQEEPGAGKIFGHLYLAKLKLGILAASTSASSAGGRWTPTRPIDLHSASSAWNPMIWRLAAEGQNSRLLNMTTEMKGEHQSTINWDELANDPLEAIDSSGHLASYTKRTTTKRMMMMMNWDRGSRIRRRKWIPFIHLSGGFKRIDSIEINPLDGSIFVLDSGTNSIRLIEPYDLNQFNLVERSDVNINRLFATTTSSLDSSSSPPSSSSSSLADGGGQQLELPEAANQQQASTGSNPEEQEQEQEDGRKLQVLIVQNPISGELMEFHSSSGLQLSLTVPPQLSSTNNNNNNINWIRSEFYYRILTNNKMVELDEDDKCDFDVQKTVLNYMIANSGGLGNQQILNQVSGAYVRLNNILDSTGNNFELVRLYTGSRFVLQSILVNHQPICEVATDYSGALTTYQPSGKDYWFELTYDTSTYLLREMIAKFDQSNQRQQAPGQRDLLNVQYDNNGNNNSYDNSLPRTAATKDRRQLKRIVYDRVFYHYCDLFIVDA